MKSQSAKRGKASKEDNFFLLSMSETDRENNTQRLSLDSSKQSLATAKKNAPNKLALVSRESMHPTDIGIAMEDTENSAPSEVIMEPTKRMRLSVVARDVTNQQLQEDISLDDEGMSALGVSNQNMKTMVQTTDAEVENSDAMALLAMVPSKKNSTKSAIEGQGSAGKRNAKVTDKQKMKAMAKMIQISADGENNITA